MKEDGRRRQLVDSEKKIERGAITSVLLEEGVQRRVEMIPPDGGWGWLVALGGCINHTLSICLVFSFSLIFSSLFLENSTSSTTIAWIFNTNQCVCNFSSFFVGPLCTIFGWRKVAFCGGLFLSVSIIVSGFVTNPQCLFVTFSFIGGLGQGMCIIISFVIVAHYFDHKKGVATGMVSVGNSVGQFLGPLLVRFLMERYGRQGTTLILGGVLLHCCLAAMTFHPIEWHLKEQRIQVPTEGEVQLLLNHDKNYSCGEHPEIQECLVDVDLKKCDSDFGQTLWKEGTRTSLTREVNNVCELNSTFSRKENVVRLGVKAPSKRESNNKMVYLLVNNLSQLKWYRVHVITLTLALIMSSYSNFLMLVPFAMAERGHTLEMISWSLSVAGFCNLVARITVATLTDFLPLSSRYYYIMGSFGVFLSIIVFPLASSNQMILITMAVFGLSVGTCMCLLSIVILEFMGLQFLPSVLGLNGLLNATFFLVVGPVTGVIRDATSNYAITMRVLSMAPLMALCLWILMPWAVSLDEKKEAASKKKNAEND